MTADEVRFRLLRHDHIPATNPHNLSYRFRLQGKDQNIVAGERLSNGTLPFDFALKVKKGKDPKRPVFTRRFASSLIVDRFVYLSWWAIKRGDYIKRVKARLTTIDWKMVWASQKQNRPITADMTGWSPGDSRKYVTWYLR